MYRFLRDHGVPFSPAKPWKTGNGEPGVIWNLGKCPFSNAHADGAFVVKMSSGVVVGRCHHDSCQGKEWEELKARFNPRRNAGEKDDWPEFIPLDMPAALPEFPVHALPGPLKDMVEEVSESRQLPADLPALVGLGIFGLVGSGKYRVRVGQVFEEPLATFTASVMEPGERKSGGFADMTAPVHGIEAELRDEAKPKIAAAMERRAVQEARLKKISKEAAQTDEPAERARLLSDAVTIRATLPEIPVTPRLYTSDTTPEALPRLLLENEGRIGMITAEGAEVFENAAGRYSSDGQANMTSLLKGHAGDPIVVDRVGRSEIIPNPVITVALALQPHALKKAVGSPDFRGRGLLARFIFAIPRSPVGTRFFVDRPTDLTIRSDYAEAVRQVFGLPQFGPKAGNDLILSISGDALGVWQREADAIEGRMAPEGDLHRFADWASKLAGGVARIAGIFHLINHRRGYPEKVPIPKETIEAAWIVGHYAIPHAVTVLSQNLHGAPAELARRVAGWIERRSGGGPFFTLGQVRKTFPAADPKTDLPDALEILEVHGYIRETGRTSTSGRGRKADGRYEISPALLDPRNGRNVAPGPLVTAGRTVPGVVPEARETKEVTAEPPEVPEDPEVLAAS